MAADADVEQPPASRDGAVARVRAEELRDSGDAGRALRAAQGVALLSSIGEALRSAVEHARELASGGNCGASWAEMRRLVASLTSRLSHAGGSGVYQPHGDDAAQCALPFAGSPHVRPRRGTDYATADETVAEGRLSCMNPQGAYVAHLRICTACRDAEAAGGFAEDAACPFRIHTICALLEGVWVEWRDGAEPPPQAAPATWPRSRSEGARYRMDAADAAEAKDAAFLAESFDNLERLGVVRRLTDVEAADPSLCAMIATVRVDWRAPVTLTSEQEEATRPRDGGLDVRRIAELATVAAASDVAAYAAACKGAAHQDTPVGRTQAFQDAVRARSPAAAVGKGRVVTGLDRTVNLHSASMSVEYPTVGTLLGGSPLGAVLRLDDGEKAYNQLPIRAEYRKYFCVQHPVTLDIYVFLRVCFGGSQSCTLFSAVSALIKSLLRAGPSARGGTGICGDAERGEGGAKGGAAAAEVTLATERAVVVTGVLDDIGQAVAAEHAQQQWAHTQRVFDAVRYVTNGKTVVGSSVVFLGAHCDTVTRAATPKGTKLFSVYRDLAFVEALIKESSSRGVRGARDAARVPFAFFESMVGSVEWLASFDSGLLLHRQGLRASLELARAAAHGALRGHGAGAEVAVWATAPCAADVTAILGRARGGRARATRFVPAAEAQAVVVRCMPSPGREPAEGDLAMQALVQQAWTASGREVTGVVSDASLDADATTGAGGVSTGGAKCWAALSPAPVHHGSVPAPGEVTFGATAPGESGWAADSLELVPLVEVLRRNGAAWHGRVVVFLTDNIGNMYRVNKGRARHGTRAHGLLAELYALADLHAIDFLALWLPRAANGSLDALSKCRSADQAAAWAATAGLRFVRAQ